MEYSPYFRDTPQPQALCRRDFDELQNWDTKVVRELEHRTYKQRLGDGISPGWSKGAKKKRLVIFLQTFGWL